MDDFEPLIIAFACNWCSYAASDVAGTSRSYYPANVRIIRVMCSGMVDPIYVLKALEGGADGVLVAGTLLGRLGLENERLRLQWISTGEGRLFAKTIEEMVNQLKEKGPSPLKERKNSLAVMNGL